MDSRKHECDLESHLHMSRNTGAMVSILPSFHPLDKDFRCTSASSNHLLDNLPPHGLAVVWYKFCFDFGLLPRRSKGRYSKASNWPSLHQLGMEIGCKPGFLHSLLHSLCRHMPEAGCHIPDIEPELLPHRTLNTMSTRPIPTSYHSLDIYSGSNLPQVLLEKQHSPPNTRHHSRRRWS